MKWFGKIGGDVSAEARLNGILLTVPKKACRCGNVINLSEVADKEIGARLISSLKTLEERAEWYRKWNALMEEALDGIILLDKFYERYVKLIGRHDTEVQGLKEAAHSVDVACPRCLTLMGKLSVTLRLINDAPAVELTKNELISLKPSPEMFAYASKRMMFSSVEQLKVWLADEDMQKAKKVLEKAIIELDALALDDKTGKIKGDLQSEIGEIDRESRQRKVDFINAVEKIMKERIQVVA